MIQTNFRHLWEFPMGFKLRSKADFSVMSNLNSNLICVKLIGAGILRLIGLRFIFAGLLFGLLSGCTGYRTPTARDEHNIGEKLDTISSLVSREGNSKGHVAIFDPTIKMIHQFNLTTMEHDRALPVREPGAEHFLLYNDSSNYVIDLTKKHLTIFNSAGESQKDPISFQGVPKSAAFRPSIGGDPANYEAFLAIYDDVGTVGLLILDKNGQVKSKTTLGPIVSPDVTIVSGDITEDGRMVLALSDDRIAVVNMRSSIDLGAWQTIKIYPSTLTKLTWMAPLVGQVNRVLVKADKKIALLDIDTQTVVASYDSSTETPVSLSKSVDPHVILATSRYGELKILYVNGSSLQSRPFQYDGRSNVLNSMLDLSLNTWTMIRSGANVYYDPDRDPIDQAPSRQLLRYRFSDQLALHNKNLPDRAQLRLTKSTVFALFPADLGYAVNYAVDSSSVQELRLFNRPYIQ